jgi:hypothetical protein
MGSVVKTVTKPFKAWYEQTANVISSTGPGASASESSEALAERLRILASKAKKKTRTMLTSAQGVTGVVGAVKKKLLGE